ncbi:helix-turn-helix domain-containing protein [Paenibacillus sp. MAH-34]|uniref:Helix-turn-helix domain-containing protein n=2 Tax=Paenibacillus anseongense TaxID=2682845 RepID=A0ABW9U7V1_9BACL|nr:helix-turn-helix domain-containing protein [Paenibacillus anseongense]
MTLHNSLQISKKMTRTYHFLNKGTTFYNLNYVARMPTTASRNGESLPFDDRNTHKSYEYATLFELEERLCSTIMRSTVKKLQSTLDYIKLCMDAIQPEDTSAARRVYLHLTHAIIRTVYKAGFTLRDMMECDIDPCASVEQFATKQEIHRYLEEICLHICKHMLALRVDKNQRIVWEIKSYIDEHFNQDFGLEHVSELMKCSSTYINRLLKQYTGSTFYNLLTARRIVSSKQLLSLNDWTVCQISNKVGYNNVHSFIRAFKRSEGITPGQYRDLLLYNALELE